MSACLPYIQPIYPAECLSDSLRKINSNFANLQEEVCTIKETVDSMVEVRTFWYYGPNAQNEPASGMQTGAASRPSNNTIKAFVNSPEQLNLPAISDINDIAFVVFQKTGFKNNLYNNIAVTGGVPYQALVRVPITRRIGNRNVIIGYTTRFETRYSDYNYGLNVGNLINEFSPTFFTWQLIYDGNEYTITPGFPRISRAQGQIGVSWNQPQNWTIY